ncbi:probable E3 ubiquitin-protein ligase makorin-1 isoform X2 [Athalia rosae]|uniref:probable E3 ubiquitin-protein ligase makorin-1 isoform X2 n=1 Tax=Athalia rosae TaxID=37344 RepID=UPI0020346161|nr:probable E3 ubiquitin-protein ligase makorin-1 isoform X2 [Athalia rosae]
MADTWKQSVICRYFVNGICREGSNCRYQHVQSTRQESATPSIPEHSTAPTIGLCRFFKQGSCKFGGRCRFKHSTQEESTPETASTSSSQLKNLTNTATVSATPLFEEDKETPWRPEEWVKAPEFVPSSIPIASSSTSEAGNTAATTSTPISYARALNPLAQSSNPASEPICPYAEATGICKQTNCAYLHGDICELCGRAALHPHNEENRKKHTNACVKQHEVDMELSFAIQRSREKSCGVCFETIMEKASREQKFGILPNCNHCFCLTCIRKWRQAKQFDNKIIRACPECRVASDFVCPSMYWVDTKEEKEKLITDYKEALSTKNCKYFSHGLGKCPFGNKCFYLHALPDGTKADVGPPVRHQGIGDADIDFLQQMILWDFLDERESRWMYSIDDLEEFVAFFSDSEDSDWSEHEMFFD